MTSPLKWDINSCKRTSFATQRTGQTMEVDEYDRTSGCKTHSTKLLTLYCGFCDKPICDKCKQTTHARHLTDIKGHEALVRAAKHRRRYIQKLAEKREHVVIPVIKNLIVQISESKCKLHSRIENVMKRYRNYASIHRDKLVIPEDEWVEELLFQAEKYHRVMDEKILYLTEYLFNVDSSFQLVKKELDSASHAELLLKSAVLRSELEFLREPKWPREEVLVTMKLKSVPDFGSVMFESRKSDERNCSVAFDLVVIEPLVYTRVFDTKLPISMTTFTDENAKISLSSAAEMYVSFGEYIVSYSLDNRRYKKVCRDVKFTCITSVRENIIDISCDQHGTLFYVTHTSVKAITQNKKILKCFAVVECPSALSVTRDGRKDIFVAFHDAGKICKFDVNDKLLMNINHPDPRMTYRPRHLTLNYINDILFSDDISNVTILDANGIWKSAIRRDVTTPSINGPLRPTGIACSVQRHVFIVDSNVTTNVHVYSEDGTYLQTAAFKNLKDAYVMNIDRTGDVWIAFKDGRVRIYRPDFMQTVRT